jgi:hypothetical protein
MIVMCYKQSGKLPVVDIFGLDTCHAEVPYDIAGCMVHVVVTYSSFAVTDRPWHSQQLKQLPNSAHGLCWITSMKMVRL